MTNLDMLVEALNYDLTHKADKTNPKSRISLSADLLKIIKNVYYSRDPKLKNISNIDLVSMAIIKLLPLKIQEQLAIKLKKSNPSIYQLLNLNFNKSSINQSQLNNETLLEIKSKQEQIITLLLGLVNNSSYELAKENKLENHKITIGDDIYSALRQDQIKSITDMLILAGEDERKRQQHLTNLT